MMNRRRRGEETSRSRDQEDQSIYIFLLLKSIVNTFLFLANIFCCSQGPHKRWPQEETLQPTASRSATASNKPQKSYNPVAHRVAVELPTFNRLAPSSWFHLADANFHLHGITKSDTKFWYVVSKLDPKILRKLSAFLAKPRGDDPYANIRAILCRTYEPKLEQKLGALLVASDLGDECPAEYAFELHRFLSNATVEDILKRILIRSLPKHLVNAISGNMNSSFDGLVEAADKA